MNSGLDATTIRQVTISLLKYVLSRKKYIRLSLDAILMIGLFQSHEFEPDPQYV